jgi:hypothetical protein
LIGGWRLFPGIFSRRSDGDEPDDEYCTEDEVERAMREATQETRLSEQDRPSIQDISALI